MADAYDVTFDRNPANAVNLTNTPRRAFKLEPSDTKDVTNLTNSAGSILPSYPRRLYFTKALTNCKVLMAGAKDEAEALDIGPILAGAVLDITIRRLWSTGTTAAPNVIGLCD